jgi:glycosyltransferase involved in cell wall biosynthesis
MIVCNVRNTQTSLTGVQRYTLELLKRFGPRVATIQPKNRSEGLKGHAWEQFVLPTRLEGRLLWSPSNTGPLAVERQVVTIMDVAPLDHPSWSGAQFSLWYRALLPKLAQRVRAILTVSHFSKSRIVHHCPLAEAKIHVVHNAADERFSPATATDIAAVRKLLAIPSPSYFLALGSLEPRKNLGRLLAAWQRIQPELPEDVWLVLAGAKGKQHVFGDHALGPLPPRVHLTGHVPDHCVPALYSGAIGCAYVSLYEGFGLPPLEAMACGTPVVTSNTSSLPEVVGDAALTVDPFDVDAIASRLLEMASDSRLRETLRSKGLVRAKMFDWNQTAEATMSVLEQASQP